MTAARQRFRTIVMTAATFIMGALPLVFATGAGAASRREIGAVVVGGMILASTMALIFVPLFYKLLENFSGSSLKCMGNPAWNMIEIRHQEMKEVKTDHYERYGTISVSIGFDIAMACGVV